MSEPETRLLLVASDAAADRLDRVLARAFSDLSRSRLQGLVRDGRVKVAGAVVRESSTRVQPGAEIVLEIPAAAPAEPRGEPIALSVVYEDEEIIVIDKPAGLVVHPAAGHDSGTLVNALIAHCGESLSGIGGVKRPGIVHRLDKDTSGLLVVAKTDRAHRGLAAQFAAHGRTGARARAYIALVWGVPDPTRGVVDGAIARSPANREKMAVVADDRGRHARTHYAVEAVFGPAKEPVASFLRCTLETGRTHQIRVHMAKIGHPLLGDESYGAGFKTKAARLSPEARDALRGLGRQALHAAVLGFEHPVSGENLHFESEPPPELQRLIAALRQAQPG